MGVLAVPGGGVSSRGACANEEAKGDTNSAMAACSAVPEGGLAPSEGLTPVAGGCCCCGVGGEGRRCPPPPHSWLAAAAHPVTWSQADPAIGRAASGGWQASRVAAGDS